MRIDRDLVRRVEWAPAELGRLQAGILASIAPESGATARPFDSGALVSFGPGRYVNRAIGLGLGDASPAEVVAALDEFYTPLGLTPSLEVSPWASEALLGALGDAGYRLERFRSVFARDLTDVPAVDAAIELVGPTTTTAREHILSGGAEPGSTARAISDEYCRAAALVPGAFDYVATVDGVVAACGSLNVVGTVAYIGGAATAPEFRGRGLQTALVFHRLREAAAHGCDIVTVTALTDGQSARNLDRMGFTQLYTQAVMTRR